MKKYRFLILSGACFIIGILASVLAVDFSDSVKGTGEQTIFIVLNKTANLFTYTASLSVIAFIFDFYIVKNHKRDECNL